MAQLQSKTLPDSRARDIRRRVDVIQKKLADLQELGIPCAFCYSSVRNTGSLFTLGDTRITDVIERHKNEILLNLNDASFEQSDTSATKEIHLILPPLSAPLDQLSRNQMQSLIVGILKDLGLKWSDPRPSWWPLEIPFVPPRCVPDNFTGNWTQALKKVIESVYTYFSYDVNTYIASRLDCLEREESSSVSIEEQPRSSSEAHLTEIRKYACHGERENGGGLKDQQSPSEIHRKQQPPKLVSSFTVENILMGTQSSSSSPSSLSSASPVSVSAEPSSSGNLATQPPVRYTKFTMVTPSSMAAEKRKGPVDSTESRLSERASSKKSSSVPSSVKDKPFSANTSDKSPTTKINEHANYSLHIVDRRNGDRSRTGSPTSNPAINLVTSVIQSTGPSDHPKLYPVPEQASRTASLHQSPLPQQFVVFFPTNSTSLTKGLQTVVYANPQAVPLAVNQPLSPNSIMPDVHSPIQPPAAIVSPSSPPSSTPGTMPHITATTTAGTSTCPEASFIPIAPKTEEIRHRMALRDSENMKLFHKRTIIKPKAPKPQKLPKPRKLRFHMTTVVKRAKRRASASLASMTIPPPPLHTHHSSQGSHEKTNDGRGAGMESKIKSPQNLEATDTTQSDIITSPDDSNSADNQSLNNDGTISPDPPEQPAVQSQTAVLKDSGFHLQVVKQSVSHPATTYRRGAKACGKRTYTKRKRELTFHLYEDPTTNFRVKRTCKRKQ